MTAPPDLPTLEEIFADLRTIRERGLVRIRHSDLAALSRAAAWTGVPAATGGGPGAVEAALRAAVDNLGGGDLAAAAIATFGLARGERDTPAQNRRRRAAMVYGVSVERFRKHHERIVMEQVAEEILKLCAPLNGPSRSRGPGADLAPEVSLAGQVGEYKFPIVVHVEPVELLSDVDVLVVPENVYLELPQHFKSSVAAAVRRTSAAKNADGEIIDDVVADELRSWVRRNGRTGLPVAPGTVAPGGPGQLAGQRIRRIYHAAIATPIAGTNYYHVEPTSIASAVRNALALARAEQALFDPALSSIAFPLFGAGRGALDPAVSFAWLWTALEREIREHGPWKVHFITRRRPLADLIVAKLRDAGIIVAADGNSVNHP
jgi:O-acetyl-ADP-ribose deacetylase (regulator of RNase III)